MSSSQEILEQVTEPLYHVEGPHWDPIRQVLYYTDIDQQLVVKYDPSTGKRTEVKVDGGAISPVLTVEGSNDTFVVGSGRDLITFQWDGQSSSITNVKKRASVDSDRPSNKFNDGKADTLGRLWIGTMETDGDQNKAGLFYFNPRTFEPVKKVVASTSNGLAWNDDDTLFYYIDTPTGYVDVFDYNKETAEISNRRHLFSPWTTDTGGSPDGMTMDADGNLWVALWGGSGVAYVNTTTGRLIRKVSVPALQVSSCTWGGAQLDTLYITTSREGLDADALAQWPKSGSVFALKNSGIKGQRTNKNISRVNGNQVGKCSTNGVTVTQITQPVEHGEGPHWDAKSGLLYFVDIQNQTVHRYDVGSGLHTQLFLEGGPVSLIIPTSTKDKFLIGLGLQLAELTWDGKSKAKNIKVLATVDRQKPLNRFNDGKADSAGRLWAGTMGPENPNLVPNQGSLFSFSKESKFQPKLEVTPVSVSNGIGWTKNDTIMFYIDSPTRKIEAFDFDKANGVISNRRTILNLDDYKIPGVPDGLCVDLLDNIWVAIHNGGRILHIDSNKGQLLGSIEIPADRVTSCAWGGKNFRTLYVTTSRRGLTKNQLVKQPLAGSLFALEGTGTKGQLKSNVVLL